jgi:[protein-PII] uridylyltransferase
MSFGEERAELLARPGLTGAGRRQALTTLTDDWIARLFKLAGGADLGAALVAVGSYGRGELSPGSDLDLLLLVPSGAATGKAAQVAADLWYPVWDSGVRLDHAMRTVAEARRVAADDLRDLLGMLDARHVAGDASLSENLGSSVRADWRAFARRRLADLRALCEERAVRAGDLAFSLEPDLKESRGGLRDLVALRAVTASWVADYRHDGLDDARRDLLDVRDALHDQTGRATDRLVQQEQPAVATRLGLLDPDALLRSVASVGRRVSFAADQTWYHVERTLASRPGRPRMGTRRIGERAPLAEGVVEQDGQVVLARDARPAVDPTLLLRVAAAAAQSGMRVAPHAIDRLAQESPPMPEPWPGQARDSLVSLLGAGASTLPVWEALDQSGMVSRLLPDWERLRSRPQRNAVHRHTVDRHLVETAMRAAELTRGVDRPDLLLVAALLHDIGKGWPGDHSEAGVAVVADLAPRLGFGADDVEVLVTLVRHHLLLPDTATRRDLDDPATVAHVASCVQTWEVLDLLHALTEADGIATGPAAWNDWKAGLVADLVTRTRSRLGGHAVPPPPGPASAYAHLVRVRRLAVLAEPGPAGLQVTVVAPDAVGLLGTVAGVLTLNRLEVRSAAVQTDDGVAVQVWQVQGDYGDLPSVERLREDVHRALAGTLDVGRRLAQREASAGPRRGVTSPAPRVDVVPHASSTATVLEVRSHDRPGLLHRIGTSLARTGVDVRAALVSTLGSEVVDVFYVVGSDGEPLPAERAHAVAAALRAALA